ncbi:hypothetical protein C8J56DRAFT_1041511 [Mycena floridula]|nr:hypothetical protein C8J56DRAFT_1041511 [Mycena floridula]
MNYSSTSADYYSSYSYFEAQSSCALIQSQSYCDNNLQYYPFFETDDQTSCRAEKLESREFYCPQEIIKDTMFFDEESFGSRKLYADAPFNGVTSYGQQQASLDLYSSQAYEARLPPPCDHNYYMKYDKPESFPAPTRTEDHSHRPLFTPSPLSPTIDPSHWCYIIAPHDPIFYPSSEPEPTVLQIHQPKPRRKRDLLDLQKLVSFLQDCS